MTYMCPVCYYKISSPPDDHYICESCGTQFNYDDSGMSHVELRKMWIEKGKPFRFPQFKKENNYVNFDKEK